jgi:CRP-like cAMP-binding protein
MPVTAEDLRRVPLLADLPEKERGKLAAELHERVIAPGQAIVTEGHGGIGFFMILDGKATVRVGDQVRAELSAGDYVGELALLDMQSPRTATVTAETEVRCAAMNAWEFRPFVRSHPDVAWHLLETLATRLREANRRATEREQATA